MDEIDKVISESITHGNEQAEYQQSYIDSDTIAQNDNLMSLLIVMRRKTLSVKG